MKLRYLIFACVLWQALRLSAGPVEDFAAARAIDPSAAAVMAIDLADGSVIAAFNDTVPLIPASILKTATIASLLQKTGVDYRYDTKVCRDGRIKGSTLEGNIIVVGSGDPSLNSREAPGSTDICAEIADELCSLGIDSIAGSIIVDESKWHGPACPQQWASADLPHAYGTGSHALNFENNASGSKSVAQPAAVFRSRLKSALAKAGIALGGNALDAGRRHTIFSHSSSTIDEIMRSCMMRSDNLFAESMLRTFSSQCGGDGSTADGARRETSFWHHRRMPLENVCITDGSGLSRSNRVTARFMAEMLASMARDIDYASFFPLAGQEGTLKSFLAGSPLDSYIALKTGSMNGIQCYAGYKLDDNYAPTHVVVVMLNSLPAGRPAARAATERMLLDLFCPDRHDTAQK